MRILKGQITLGKMYLSGVEKWIKSNGYRSSGKDVDEILNILSEGCQSYTGF